jgi:hypothetical protein
MELVLIQHNNEANAIHDRAGVNDAKLQVSS